MQAPDNPLSFLLHIQLFLLNLIDLLTPGYDMHRDGFTKEHIYQPPETNLQYSLVRTNLLKEENVINKVIFNMLSK